MIPINEQELNMEKMKREQEEREFEEMKKALKDLPDEDDGELRLDNGGEDELDL